MKIFSKIKELLKSYWWLIILVVFVGIIFIMYLQQENSCRPDSFITSIMNGLTAIGTMGAVIVALWLSRSKKEKLEGKYNILNYEYKSENGNFYSLLDLLISVKNIGDIDIDIENIKVISKNNITGNTLQFATRNVGFIGIKPNNKYVLETLYSISRDYIQVKTKINFWEKKIDPNTDIEKVKLYTTKNNAFELKYDKNLKESE